MDEIQRLLKWLKPATNVTIYAPSSGKLKPLIETAGEGFTITSNSKNILSPIKGKVIISFLTGDTVLIENSDNVKILVYVDASKMKSKETVFENIVEKNTLVNVGDKIVSINPKLLSEAKTIDINVIATKHSSKKYKVIRTKTNEIDEQEFLFKLCPYRGKFKTKK